MTFQELLDELAEAARSNRDKGTQFEKLIANYLLTDPQYADRLADVWLWEEWPDRWSTDVGIDLVARERGTGSAGGRPSERYLIHPALLAGGKA